jgi:epsilon-lactone hydrolase
VSDRGIDLVMELFVLAPRHGMTIEERRAQYDRAEKAFPLSPRLSVEELTIGDMPAEFISPVSCSGKNVFLYLHGGGYMLGSPRSHRHLAGAIAEASEGSALVPHYRRAPEQPFPAALEDAVAAYQWLLRKGHDPRSIVIGGDSAGGGLTIACLMFLRDAGIPLPAAAVCISPWVDLTCSASTYASKAGQDPLLTLEGLRSMATAYLGSYLPKVPLISPLYGDLHGLPDLLIHVGEREILLDDAVQLAALAKSSGVETVLEVWDEMVHVWHWYVSLLEDANTAIERIGIFVKSKTGSSGSREKQAFQWP